MAALLVAYVIAVLLVDTLATQHVEWPFAWDMFIWKPRTVAPFLASVLPQTEGARRFLAFIASARADNFDLFKLTFWFVVPLLFSLRWMNWGAWGLGRWKKRDWALLGFAAIAGFGAMFLIPHLPGVSTYYKPPQGMTSDQKQALFLGYNLWTATWLPGWEFLHRYVLLAALAVFLPRGGRGWLVVPLLVAGSEMAYHLVKPWPETLAMFGFGFLATAWAYQRANMLLPLIAHWMIEVSLVLFYIISS